MIALGAAGDAQVEHVLSSKDGQRDLGADVAAELFADGLGVEITHVKAFDHDDLIAGQEAGLGGGEAGRHLTDVQGTGVIVAAKYGAHRAGRAASAAAEKREDDSESEEKSEAHRPTIADAQLRGCVASFAWRAQQTTRIGRVSSELAGGFDIA